MLTKNAAKLPSVFIPVLFFIIFDLTALGLNFWISFHLEKSAVAINLSGRQRMLSQRMTKALLVYEVSQGADAKKTALTEFIHTVKTFDNTLKGFRYGGMTVGGDGKPLFLPKLRFEDEQLVAASAEQLWTIVLTGLSPLLAQEGPVTQEAKQLATKLLLDYNGQLLDLMNKLTSLLEQNTKREIVFLRMFQAGILCMALANFWLVCIRLMRRVKQSQNNAHALENIIDSIDTGIILYGGDQVISSSNNAAKQLFGYSEIPLTGKKLGQLLMIDGDRVLGIKSDNTSFIAKTNTQLLFEGEYQIYICTILDVSEQRLKEQRLSEMAFHDPLTGLPNRALLADRLGQEILHAKRVVTSLAVLFLDLDGFKSVNDNFGHDAGDELLRLVAKRFQRCCRDEDTVARIGGDEFVFVLNAIPNRSVAKQIATIILKAASETYNVYQHNVTLSASIGIAFYPADDNAAEALLKKADSAMYLAKHRGKNGFAFASEL